MTCNVIKVVNMFLDILSCAGIKFVNILLDIFSEVCWWIDRIFAQYQKFCLMILFTEHFIRNMTVFPGKKMQIYFKVKVVIIWVDYLNNVRM